MKMYALRSTKTAALAVIIAFAIAFAAVVLPAHQAHAATSVKASASTISSPAKFGAYKGADKTVGGTSKALSAIKVKPSGTSVSYAVLKGSSWKSAKNNKATGGKAKTPVSAIKMKLSGVAAKQYDLYYRVFVPGYGWMGWAKNNEKAGSPASTKMYVSGYQFKLVAKGAVAPNTDRAAYGAFIKTITGDAKTDAAIKKFVKSQGMDLEKCCKVISNGVNTLLKYSPTNRGEIATSSGFTKARIKTEAKAAFVTTPKQGDCYTFATAAYCAATYLGYNVELKAGKYLKLSYNGPVASASASDWGPFAWINVTVGGKKYIYDNYQYHTLLTQGATVAAKNPDSDLAKLIKQGGNMLGYALDSDLAKHYRAA